MASLLSSGDPTLEQISSYLATSSDLSFDNSYYFASDYYTGSYNNGIRSFRVYFWDPTQNPGQKWVQKYSQTSSQSNFGHQIACTWDGNRFVVGSPDENKVYVYHSPGGSGSQLWTHNASGVATSPTVHTISCPDSGSRRFGWSVAIAKDLGNHIIIGAPGNGNNGTDTTGLERGKVYIYEFNGTTNTWSKTFEKSASQSHTDVSNAGSSVSISEPEIQLKESSATSGQAFYQVNNASPQFGFYVDISGYAEYIAIGVPGTPVGLLNSTNLDGYSGNSSIDRTGGNSDYFENTAQLGCIVCYKTSNTTKSWASNTSLHGKPVRGQTEMSWTSGLFGDNSSNTVIWDFNQLGITCKISLDGTRLIGGSPRYSFPGKQQSPNFGRLDAWNYSTTDLDWVLGKGRVVGNRPGNRLGLNIAVDYTGQRVVALFMKQPMEYSSGPGSGQSGIMVFDWNGNGFYEVIPEVQTYLGSNGDHTYGSVAISKGDVIAATAYNFTSNGTASFYFYKLTGGYDGNSLVGGYCAADTFLVGPNDGSTENTFKKQIKFGGTFFDNYYENTTIENRIYVFDANNTDGNQQGFSELLFSKKSGADAPDMIRLKANEFRIDTYVNQTSANTNQFYTYADGEYDHHPALTMNVAGNFKLNPEFLLLDTNLTSTTSSTANKVLAGIENTQCETKALLDVEGDIFGRRRINAGYLQGQQILGRKWPWQILYDTRSIHTVRGNTLHSNTFNEFNSSASYKHGRINSTGTSYGSGNIMYYENEGAIALPHAGFYIINNNWNVAKSIQSNGISGSFWFKLKNEHSTYSSTGVTVVSYGNPHASFHNGFRFQVTNNTIRFNFGAGKIQPSSNYGLSRRKWYHIYYAFKPTSITSWNNSETSSNPGSSYFSFWINNIHYYGTNLLTTSGTLSNASSYAGKHYVGSDLNDSAANIYIGMVAHYNSHINQQFHGTSDNYIGQFANAMEMYNWGPPGQKLAVGGDAFIEKRLSVNYTHTPNYALEVGGDINLTGDLRINGVAQSFGGTGSSVWSTSSSDVYRSSGKVGIGTSSPGYVLDVNGDINMSTGSSFRINGVAQTFGGGSGGSSVWSTSGSDVYRSGGKVGIGTSSPSAPLHVTASGGSNPGTNGLYVYNSSNFSGQDAIVTCRVAGSSAGDAYIAFDVNGEAGWSWGMDNDDNNKMKLATNWDSLSNNTKMTIDTTGKVGIGTTSPSGPLHIYEATGSSRSATSGTLVLDHGNSGGSSCIIFPSRVNNNSDYGYIQYEDSTSSGDEKSQLIIGTENDGSGTNEDNVILAPSGKVGIGTNTPSYLLDVNGDINMSAGSSFRINGVAQSFGGGGGSGSSLSGTNTFEWGAGVSGKEQNAGKIGYSTWSTGTNDALDIVGAGTTGSNRSVRIWDRLGIGTSSPSSPLHIIGDAFLDGSGSSDVSIHFNKGSGTVSKITSGPGGDDLRFYSDRWIKFIESDTMSNKFVIDGNNGKIGINHSTPDSCLHISSSGGQLIYLDGTNYTSQIHMNRGSGNWYMATTNTSGWNQNLGWFANTSQSGNPIKRIFRFENDSAGASGMQSGTPYGIISFTGQHISPVIDITPTNVSNYAGLIVSSNQNDYLSINTTVPLRGAKNINVNEAIPVVKISTKAQDKACFGVISWGEDPNEERREQKAGHLVNEWNKEKGDNRVYINSIGEGGVWVVNTNGNLEAGDYITTSNVSGYGMKQTSEFLANYTVAKITMDCNFNPGQVPVKQIKKVSATNTYYVRSTDNDTCTETSYNTLDDETKALYTKDIRTEMVNVLDSNGVFQWEDTSETELAYNIRYLDANGIETTQENAVHIAAFVGCTYHCG